MSILSSRRRLASRPSPRKRKGDRSDVTKVADAVRSLDAIAATPTVWIVSRMTGVEPGRVPAIFRDLEASGDFPYGFTVPEAHPDPSIAATLNVVEFVRSSLAVHGDENDRLRGDITTREIHSVLAVLDRLRGSAPSPTIY